VLLATIEPCSAVNRSHPQKRNPSRRQLRDSTRTTSASRREYRKSTSFLLDWSRRALADPAAILLRHRTGLCRRRVRINLQTPARSWCGDIDIHDQALDVLAPADRTWRWKDEDEFAERSGHPLFWDEACAATKRRQAERLIALAESGQFPFDGTWCSFRPGPGWRPTSLPWWWDQLPPREPPAWQRTKCLDWLASRIKLTRSTPPVTAFVLRRRCTQV
jgi:hypothetical protein